MEGDDYKYFARNILETIIQGLDGLSGREAWQIATAAIKTLEDERPGYYKTISDSKLIAEIFRRGAGRGEPGQKTWADLLKEPEHAAKIERTISAEVQKPRDLAALVEAMRRRKLLNNQAGNGADIIRASADIIGESRAGSAKNLRENRQRYTTKETGKITYFLGLLANLGL